VSEPTPPEPEIELARPARAPGSPPSSSPSNPRLQAVRSAARADAPASDAKPTRKVSRESLQEGAVDTLLNSVSILGEVLEDFRSSDRFFKYKALVLVLWLSLTVGAFGVACPQRGPSNDINARLVVSGDVYMVKNESNEQWQDVEIIVNKDWRATETRLDANGGSLTLSPAVIFDANGNRAPSSLKITDIEVHVLEPEAEVVLLKAGLPQ
jgi:hypothetical protein